jgi:lauroyl/myristoyl acyltransferase
MRDPLRRVRIPAPLAALGVWRGLFYRSLPLRWALSFTMATVRLDMARRPSRRRYLLGVLRSILGDTVSEREINRYLTIARALRKLGGHTYAPVFRRPRGWLLRSFRPQGLDHLDALRAAGGGLIILGTHVGQHHWVAPILRQLGYSLRLTQRRRSAVDTYLLMRRDGALPHMLPFPATGEEGPHLKKLHDMLRSGVWLQHTGDYPAGAGGVCGTFMGRSVRCAPAPWVLARMARVPVVAILVLTGERLQTRMFISPPIRVEPAAALPDGLQQPFQTYLDFVTRHIVPAPWNIGLKHWQSLFPQDWPDRGQPWG